MDVINQLVANHDKDPKGTAKTLLELNPDELKVEVLPTYSWLLNHVVGELLGDWQEAFIHQAQVAAREGISPVIHFNHAISALNAGKPLDAWHAQSCYQSVTGMSKTEVELVIRQGVLQYSTSNKAFDTSFLPVLEDCLKQTSDWKGDSKVASSLAPSLTNIVSSWLELPLSDGAPVNSVMQKAALRSQELWAAGGGNWLNAERACYLRAMAANHIADWKNARDAAMEGIMTIESNGEEDVDRACLLLELSRAYGGMYQPEKQQESRQEAISLSKTFAEKFPDEPELGEWFEGLLNKA